MIQDRSRGSPKTPKTMKNRSESRAGVSWGASGCLGTPGGQCFFHFKGIFVHKGRPERAFGIQKMPRNRLGGPKRRSREGSTDHFCGNFAANTVFPHFPVDLGSILDENSIQKAVHVFTAVRVFCNLATFTKHRILQVRSHFFMF